jgi:hypothetical protein
MLLRDRFRNMGDLSNAQLINTITWAFIETFILSNWIPGLPNDAIKHIAMVELYVRCGGNIKPTCVRSVMIRTDLI